MGKCACNCSCEPSFDKNTELNCDTIQNKKWYKFHVPAELFDEMNNYVKLVQVYLHRDKNLCECDFATEANNIGLKIRVLLRQLEDQINGLGEEFVDLQKTLCTYIAKMDKALEDAGQALEHAENAIALAEEVSQGFEEFKTQVNEAVEGLEDRLNGEIATRASEDTRLNNAITAEQTARQNAITGEQNARQQAISQEATARQNADSALGNRITALEQAPQTDTTYSLSKSGDTVTLTGSDGSTSSITSAPEATTEDIMSIFD